MTSSQERVSAIIRMGAHLSCRALCWPCVRSPKLVASI